MIDSNYLKLRQKRILNISIPSRIIGQEYKLLDFYKTQYIHKMSGKRSTYYSIEHRRLIDGSQGIRFVSAFESKDFFNLLSDAEKIRIAFVKKVDMEKKNDL